MIGYTMLDLAALGWFAACWAGYTIFADHRRWRDASVSAAMDRYRTDWMREMLGRELRMIDTTIMGNILTATGFFASTTILVVGGLIAALGASEAALEIVGHLPFLVHTTRAMLEIKLIVMLGIFVFAFFKLAWSFRLYNNCSVLIGAAPQPPVEPVLARDYAARAAKVLSFAAQHGNRGLRAYFFALAVLAWFLHPIAFAGASTLVVLVLYRREFRSRTLRAVGRTGVGGAGPGTPGGEG